MAGIRWSQIQNLNVTEQEINLLAGLIATASQLNVMAGYAGTAADLNAMIGAGAQFLAHINADISTAHDIPAGSIDGLAIADGTLPVGKLAFDVATQIELNALQAQHNDLQSDHTALQAQVDTLASIVIPGQGQDIAEGVAQAVAHIEDPTDAHDATAISYGENESGYYFPIADLLAGNTQIEIGSQNIRYFRVSDSVKIQSNIAPEFNTEIIDVDVDAGIITLDAAPTSNYNVSDQFRIWNLNEVNVQQGIDRSLKNNTDIFTGRLTFDSPYEYHQYFTSTALFKSEDGYDLFNNNDLSIFAIDNDGHSRSNTHTLRDYVNNFDGLITKQDLTADRTWTFPDRDGFIGIGDMTFWDLLRVTADTNTGAITIAPGVMTDLYNQKVRAWVNMAQGSDYPGETFDLATGLNDDGQLAGLGSDYLAFIVYLTYNDDVFLWYSSAPQATEQDAIDAIPPYLPTAYMKLALLTVQGDGLGGIDASTIKIHEDMRPILSQGMSNSHYDESIHFPTGLTAATLVPLPDNSRAGNKPQGFIAGSAELEVYVNDTFRERVRDYVEVTGTAPGQIAFNYDLPANSVVRFRINWGAATNITGGGSGGGGAGNLQDAYLGGPNIFTLANTPVTIAAGVGDALDVTGSVNITGFISSTAGSELVNQVSEPGNLASPNNKLYANNSGDLLYKKQSTGTTYNLTQQLDNAGQQQGRLYLNNTGSTIPAFRTVALHPTVPGQIIPGDVSSTGASSKIIGITAAAINTGSQGLVVWRGYLAGAGAAFTHNELVHASPSGPGAIAGESTLSLTAGNAVVEIGLVDGTGMLVDINRKGQV